MPGVLHLGMVESGGKAVSKGQSGTRRPFPHHYDSLNLGGWMNEIIEIDNQLREMIAKKPGLAHIYKDMMGEEFDSVVVLPRMPTLEDWAAAEALARERT